MTSETNIIEPKRNIPRKDRQLKIGDGCHLQNDQSNTAPTDDATNSLTTKLQTPHPL